MDRLDHVRKETWRPNSEGQGPGPPTAGRNEFEEDGRGIVVDPVAMGFVKELFDAGVHIF